MTSSPFQKEVYGGIYLNLVLSGLFLKNNQIYEANKQILLKINKCEPCQLKVIGKSRKELFIGHNIIMGDKLKKKIPLVKI